MESTIKKRMYILAGVTVFLLISMVVAWGFALNRPLLENIQKERSSYEERRAVADKLPDALAARKAAEERREYVKGQLAFFRQRYRSLYLDTGLETDTKEVKEAKTVQTWQRWMNEYYAGYGIALKRELEGIATASQVTIRSAIKVDPPPKAPEEVTPPPSGLLKPTTGGVLSVEIIGPYPAILQFLDRINQSRILMVVGNIKLEGSSPFIRASFPITPYLVATGPAVKLQGAPAAAAPVASPDAGATSAPSPPDPPSDEGEDTGSSRIGKGGGGGDE